MPNRLFKVFVVEDDAWYNKLIVHTVSLNPDVEVESFTTAGDMLRNLNKQPDLVTVDYRLPDMNGGELIQLIKSVNSCIKVVVISEQEEIEVAVDLLKDGAYDYLIKNSEIKERLLNTLSHLIRTTNLEKKIAVLQQEVERKYDFQSAIIGNSAALMAVFELMRKAANTNINIFISGETGTGKELVAKAIHYNSDRRDKAYVPVNIAALSKELVESELFGHEKGAFTGAVSARKGRFEEANNGTLFLDEIAELDMALQTKLLRVLQEKEYSPIGSNVIKKTNFRLIVATHKNLSDEVKNGTFREDLYYRIMGLTLLLPPLRERGHDVLILASEFIQRFCTENKIKEKKITPEAQSVLLSHSFPGNVRELKSVIETAVVLSDNDWVTPADLVFQRSDELQQLLQSEFTLREYTYKIIQFMLNKYQKDIQIVAQKLDISPATIYRVLKEFQAD